MGFKEAVKTVYNKYATFQGRATRSEYWYFYLFFVIVDLALIYGSAIIGSIFNGLDGFATGMTVGTALYGIFALASFLPSLAVSVRRLHDTNRSGWNVLWSLLPLIGAIILLVFFVTPSKESNQYGEKPE